MSVQQVGQRKTKGGALREDRLRAELSEKPVACPQHIRDLTVFLLLLGDYYQMFVCSLRTIGKPFVKSLMSVERLLCVNFKAIKFTHCDLLRKVDV